jgi:hypothetical protein
MRPPHAVKSTEAETQKKENQMVEEKTQGLRIVVENVLSTTTLSKTGNVLTKQKIWNETVYELEDYIISFEFFNNIFDEYTMMEDLAGDIHIVRETFLDAWKEYQKEQKEDPEGMLLQPRDYTPEELSLFTLIENAPEGAFIHIYF